MFPNEIHAKRFDALMGHVRRRFNVLPLRDAIAKLRERALPTRALAITFDDGYRDNLAIAAPILKRHGVPATVFIAPAYLDGGCMWNDVVIEACRSSPRPELNLGVFGLGVRGIGDVSARRALVAEMLDLLKYRGHVERDALARQFAQIAESQVPSDLMLTSGSLDSLSHHGIEIGAHTSHHPILAQTSVDVAWSEIRDSRVWLERSTGKKVTMFAYPNGKPYRDYRIEHVQMVREAGYEAAVSTAHGAANVESDVYQLPRFTPWHYTSNRFDVLMMKNLTRTNEERAS
jgi:peptidoglycan/xylan/chitin deacetylase (PgdA/CDA1 family)